MSYYDYVQRHIYAKAGMQSTASLPEPDDVPARAQGYTREGARWVSNEHTLPFRGMAAGGGYSTVDDLDLTIKGDGRGDNLIMEIRPAVLPAKFAPTRMAIVDALVAVRERASRKTAADQFSGALLLAKGEQILLQQAWGYADRAASRTATIETQFRLGSLNKMFTAVAVLQLVDSGKLSLEGTVGQYLPDYPNRDVAAKVRLHHLLTHTGGTGDIFGPEFDAHRLRLKEHADYVALFGKRGLEFEPGTRDGYSNYGYVLLRVRRYYASCCF